MYTNLKNIQILISLLKQYEIKNLVLSPGSRNVAFVHSVEKDDFFKCYSIVDERSAAYFALGLAKRTNEPVLLSCTSSTASANYLPAIQEANKIGAKIIAFTADRDYRKLYQMEDQMIDQINMYGKYVIDEANIPIIRDEDDVWYAERLINRVLIQQKYKKQGPVQINIQIDDFGDFCYKQLPIARKIDYIKLDNFNDNIKKYQNELSLKKKILVLCGQDMIQNNSQLKNELIKFQQTYNSVISFDEFSAAKSEEFIKTLMITESMHIEDFEEYCPDLVITIGGHVWSFIKYKLRNCYKEFDHWHISEIGEINDGLKALTKVFEMSSLQFFQSISKLKLSSDRVYYNKWNERRKNIKLPELKYSNFFAINELLKNIPKNSLIHMSVLNSIRLSNFLGTPEESICYANLGTDGIDGCLSTFLGQSNIYDKLSFLIIGDLSSLYDMSAFQYLTNCNQRVFIINNHVGSEFYNNFASYIDSVDDYIGASHNSSLKGVRSFSNIKYLMAKNEKELIENMKIFVNESNQPIIFEVFTDPNIDTMMLKEFYNRNLKMDTSIMIKKVKKKILSKFAIK